MIRVAQLTYLNVAPFYWGCAEWNVALVPCVPSALGRLAAQGEIDAGPMSLVDWWAQADRFEPLGPYGLAAAAEAQSVLLFSARPLADLDGAVVGVTPETSTSVCLLRLLLEGRAGVVPREYRRGAAGDAWLVIGDEALRQRARARAPFVYDLGAEWRAWTGLPFTFARWVVRRDLPAAEKAALRGRIGAALAAGLAALADLAAARAGAAGLSAAEIARYLRGFTYELGEREERGQAEFHRQLAALAMRPELSAAPPAPSARR